MVAIVDDFERRYETMENHIKKKTVQIETMQKQIDQDAKKQRDLEAQLDDKSKDLDK